MHQSTIRSLWGAFWLLVTIYLLPGILLVELLYKSLRWPRHYGTAESQILMFPAVLISTSIWIIIGCLLALST